MIAKPFQQRISTDWRLLDFSAQVQRRYEAVSSSSERKARGQFFTPPSIAAFMAGMFDRIPDRVRVLDPGAGVGTLTAAVCDRILRLRSPRHIQLVLYETDSSVVPYLEETLAFCRSTLKRAGHHASYDVRSEDFILANAREFQGRSLFDEGGTADDFDAVIMNPPFFKIQGDSEYARVMSRVVHGQPNVYPLFMALAARLLRSGGQLVAITPRSFCGGPYFRSFRRWYLEHMSLRRVHLFESRRDAFRDANVLQESVVTSSVRSAAKPDTITLSTSFGADVEHLSYSRSLSSARVIDDTGGDMVIRLPETEHDARILEIVDAWPKRFAEHGLRVSTGPVVMFRAKEFLLQRAGDLAAPLVCVHNIRPFETVWPLRKNGKPIALAICPETVERRLLLPTRNYVLLRRFSAKEERRRLTASCFFAADRSSGYVAFENHVNYVYHHTRELAVEEAIGLAALFNSSLLDRYFRALSGNTQVNATELRTMPFPDIETVRSIGSSVEKLDVPVGEALEEIVLEALGINGPVKKYLMELAL